MQIGKKILTRLTALLLPFFIPLSVFAADTAAHTFAKNIVAAIIQPLILFFYALAFLLFVQGIGGYILNAANPKERAKGTQHIIWGIVGFFIMTSVYFILNVVVHTFFPDVTVPN